MWQQWRTAYPGAYSALEAIADEPQNITSQVRQLILLEDPYRGSTDKQGNIARSAVYQELDLDDNWDIVQQTLMIAVFTTYQKEKVILIKVSVLWSKILLSKK
ncbi:hypothetical protein Tco_0796491 [Tanacetum coccineum]